MKISKTSDKVRIVEGKCELGGDEEGFEMTILRVNNCMWSYELNATANGNVYHTTSLSQTPFETQNEAVEAGIYVLEHQVYGKGKRSKAINSAITKLKALQENKCTPLFREEKAFNTSIEEKDDLWKEFTNKSQPFLSRKLATKALAKEKIGQRIMPKTYKQKAPKRQR